MKKDSKRKLTYPEKWNNMVHNIKHIRTVGLIAIILAIVEFGLKYGHSEYPYKKDIENITYIEFTDALNKDSVDTVYYSSTESDMYVKFADGTYGLTDNPDTYSYKKDLLEYGIFVKDISEMCFGEDDDLELMNHAFVTILVITFATFMIGFIYMTVRENSLKKDNIFSGDIELANSSMDQGILNVGVPKEITEDKVKKDRVKTFKDVAGLKEIKEDMMSLVDFLKNRDKYIEAGAKLPRGIILYGPPGTGKTLLAKAIAGEVDIPFLNANGSDFIELYVGVGAKRIRELFEKAKKQAPCIVFIDEIDTIGNRRGAQKETGEDRKTINALLTEMDGFNENDNILVIGATNRIDDLDPALMRPGRFTDKFCVPLPQTVSERKEIINIYMKGKCFGDNVVLEELAKETSGFSPAQIESWMNEAAIIQVQQDKKYITKEMLDEAMSKMLIHGHIRKDQSERDKKELELVAWHESGHAILGKLFGNTISKVTILSSTSGAGGITFSTPKDKGLLSVQDMEMKVMELYGGRLAELLFNNGDEQLVTTGASNDIERATEIIHSMVVSYGMTEDFGLLNLEKAGTDKEYIINKEIEISRRLQEKATELLKKNYESLKLLASKLLEQDTVYGKDIDLLNLEK